MKSKQACSLEKKKKLLPPPKSAFYTLKMFGKKSLLVTQWDRDERGLQVHLNLSWQCIFHDLHLAPVGTKLTTSDDSKICQNLINF